MDLTDAIDVHVHSAPDVYPRSGDDLELARAAETAGMRGLLLKSHHTLTADRAALVSRQVGIDVFGGLALNLPAGGLNPEAVHTAIAFGAKEIWMPTIHARHCLHTGSADMFRAEATRVADGLTVLDDRGDLQPVVSVILEQIRDAGIALGTGHLAPAESLTLLRRGRDLGLSRMVVTHPLMSFTRFAPDQMRAAVELGALLEFDYLSCCPGWPQAVSPSVTAAAIIAAGPSHCVMATDGGQADNPAPPEMFQAFAGAMQAEGISRADLRTMMCDNPRRLLGL